jgi:histidinol-phosphate phosphatase family protein
MSPRATALLLTRGLETRLRPLTDRVPGCLVPIGSRPLLDYWVECLTEAGISEVRIDTHACVDRVREHIESVNARGELHLAESRDTELLGSDATAIANADLAESADEIVVVDMGNLSDIDLRPVLAFHRQHGDPFTMVLFRASNSRSCGIAELDGGGRIVSFVEKLERPASNLANAGLYVINAAAYREIAAMGVSDLGFDVFTKFVGRMRGWVWGGYHRNIGTLQALERAHREVSLVFPDWKKTGHRIQRPAIFLDRDGTIIEHVHYLSDPRLVRLLPGAAEALIRFRKAGFARVLVTNQSAIGRGMFTTDRLEEIHSEMRLQLAACGATIDAIYYCPDAPSGDDQTVAEKPDRKPGPGMLLRAAADLGLDLEASWMIGDLISDVLAGQNAGCRSVLLETAQTLPENARAHAGPFVTAPDLMAAANLILADSGERG